MGAGVGSVTRDVFGTAARARIRSLLDGFCRAHLGAGVERLEFSRASIGSVHGLRLADGRRVVLKAHRAGADTVHIAATQRVQSSLAGSGFPCPRPLLGPTPLANGVAVVETLLDRGAKGDPRDPAVRVAMVSGLALLVDLCRPMAEMPGLRRWFGPPADRLFPPPHDPRFDFDGTAPGAGWINRLALAAARRLDAPDPSQPVVGHCDWRGEHLRFDGGELCAAYDWDSLGVGPEPVIVGSVAHGFTADWSADSPRQAPTIDDCRGFVADYEMARGAPFRAPERRALDAALVYALAYTSRCEHSDELTHRATRPPARTTSATVPAGSFRALLARHGAELLGLPLVGEPSVGP